MRHAAFSAVRVGLPGSTVASTGCGLPPSAATLVGARIAQAVGAALRTPCVVNVATFVFGVAFAWMFFGHFVFLMQAWHYSLPQAGLSVAPGPRRVAGRLLYAAGALWLPQRTGTEPGYLGTWLPGQVLRGTAVGMVQPSPGGAAVARLTPARLGIGSAVNPAVRQIGGVMGVAATVALAGHAGPQLADFHTLYLTHVVLALAAALPCLHVHTRPAVRRRAH